MDKNKKISDMLAEVLVFRDFSQAELLALAEYFSPVDKEQGCVVINQGDTDQDFYILLDGSVKVLFSEKDEEYDFAILGKNRLFGELSVIDGLPRSASVVTEQKCSLLKFNFSVFLQQKIYSELHAKLILALSNASIIKQRSANTKLVDAMRSKIAILKEKTIIGLFVIATFSIFSLFIIVVSVSHRMLEGVIFTAPLSIVLMLGILFGIYRISKRLGWTLKNMGLDFSHWRRDLFEGVVFTLPILAIILIIKIVLIHFQPSGAQDPIINIFGYKTLGFIYSWWVYLFAISFYLLSSVVQELMARGFLQNFIQRYLTYGKSRKVFTSIVISNLIFSAFHSFLTPVLIMSTLILGLFWGWLYSRHNSIIGAAASHMLVGVWGLFILSINIMQF